MDAARLRAARLPLALAACAAVLPLALAWLPARLSTWLPACPLYALTGLACPGCGATRALAALGHGDLHAALERNGLAVAALACLGLWGASVGLGLLLGRPVPRPPRWLPAVALTVTLAFGIARNL